MIENVMKKANDQVFDKISEAQNKLFDLPTEKEVARFYAKSLSSIPGVTACRVCLGHTFSQKGDINGDPCKECDDSRRGDKEIAPVPKEMQCKLETLPGSYILPIETIDHRFGFFIFLLDQEEWFEPCKPLIKNLGNFVALSLENRLQKLSLKKGKDALEENEKRTKRLLASQKTADQERMVNLRLWESMNSTSRAIHDSNDLEKMMTDILDVMLSTFDCDRTWLIYPCDPEATSWSVPMERTKPEYPGVSALRVETPMDEGVAGNFRIQLSSKGPVKSGLGTEPPLLEEVSQRFGFKSLISIALHPKIGKPWQFGMHQCSYARQWTVQEERLFLEIGRRLEDGLTSLLSYRKLQESEERYRLVFENSPVSIREEDFSSVKALFDSLRKEGVSDIDNYLNQHPEVVRRCAEMVKILDVNSASLVLHGAANKDELLAGLCSSRHR